MHQSMFHPAVHDLVKPQWLAVLARLKTSGGMSVSELSRDTDGSYMTIKAHCEELTGRGYLIRTRLPRTGTGRPEILYSLAARADSLFAEPGAAFALDLLAEARLLYGDIAPERILHQWFHRRADAWKPALASKKNLSARATKLAALRSVEGWHSVCESAPLRLIDYHHPLQRLFETHPRAIVIEHRMLETLLHTKIQRREESGGREGMPIIIYEFAE
jgi:predicted ArsR family transcriptional regulator